MRYSTLRERKEFYFKEFDMKKAEQWFRDWYKAERINFAVIIGRHTHISPRKYMEDASTTIIIDDYYAGFQDLRSQILNFLPESTYYDRNVYDKRRKTIGQELAFDLDPENLTCPIHGNLADKMKRRQGLAFCEIELAMVKNETIELHEELLRIFSDIRVVYSGRGFHIHVFDRDAFTWSYRKKRNLAKQLKKKGFLIDEWVTTGGMRLIRLPYSLHGMVSRIVLPVKAAELKMFNPVNDSRCVPMFISG
jgi:DNA primase catalytic subunit